MITGIHHFSMIVSAEPSVEFYKRLGFTEYKRIRRDYDTVVLLDGYGVGLELFIDPTHPARSKPEPLGLRQLSLGVDDIVTTIKELGVEAEPVMTDWFGKGFCLIFDPDGNSIQLHE
jgi:glyoxylase I family protein